MDDPLVVSRLKRRRDLLRDFQGILDRHGASTQPCRKVFAIDEFHHERADGDAAVIDVFDAVQLRDMGMVQRCECLRFAHETLQPLGVPGKLRAQKLQRDIAIEPRVVGTIDLAHTSGADGSDDAIRPER